MSSAAQLDESSGSYQEAGTDGRSGLKELAAERLAAHRNRRAVAENRAAQALRERAEAQAEIRLQARRTAARAEGHPDVSRVREAVAARYQTSSLPRRSVRLRRHRLRQRWLREMRRQ